MDWKAFPFTYAHSTCKFVLTHARHTKRHVHATHGKFQFLLQYIHARSVNIEKGLRGYFHCVGVRLTSKLRLRWRHSCVALLPAPYITLCLPLHRGCWVHLHFWSAHALLIVVTGCTCTMDLCVSYIWCCVLIYVICINFVIFLVTFSEICVQNSWNV